MTAVKIAAAAVIGLSLFARVASAQDHPRSLSLRSGYSMGSSSSDFGNSAAHSLVGAVKLGRRMGLLASLGYQPSARTTFGNGACLFDSRPCTGAQQNMGVASLGVGLRLRPGDLAVSQYLPFLEVLPTLFYGSWDDPVITSTGEIRDHGMKKAFVGVQTNLVVPFRLNAQLSLDMGLGYSHSANLERDDGSHRSGLRHFQAFGGVTWGL